MHLSGTSFARLGAVHAVGLAALALATPAHAADDPPPPVTRAPVFGLTFEAPDEAQPDVAAILNAVNSLVGQENPANMPPPASATTQADTVGPSPSQAISPTHAQQSPERASTNEAQHRAVSAPSDEKQYHPRHVQYQRHSNVRTAAPRLVLATATFSPREPRTITPSSSPIESPIRSRNHVPNCSSDPDGSSSPDLPVESGATLQCTPDPPADELTSVDPPEAGDCDDTGGQYQADDAQYQTPVETTCDTSGDPVVPVSQPDGATSSTPVNPETAAATDVVPPTTEPVAAPAAADTVPTQCGAEVLSAPASPHPAKKVVESRLIGKPSRPRFSSPKQQSRGGLEISAQRRSVTQNVPAPLPLQAPSTEARSSISSREIEALASLRLEPASSRVSVFRGWFVASVALSFVFAFGLLLSAIAITVGRSLRARVGSKGLSDHRVGASRPGGIKYRE
jgi:hypothetical protein